VGQYGLRHLAEIWTYLRSSVDQKLLDPSNPDLLIYEALSASRESYRLAAFCSLEIMRKKCLDEKRREYRKSAVVG
jgi:hypothetical protein